MASKPHLLIILLSLCGIFLGIWLAYEPTPNTSARSLYKPVGGDFTLQNINGHVSLSDFEGQYKILYFGYSYCPDYCPADLGHIAHFYMQLDETIQQQVQVIFVSVDPGRDTPERLQTYMQYFHKDFIGISGTKEQIDEISKRYDVVYRLHNEQEKQHYSVDHTTHTYLIDRENRVQFLVSSTIENFLKTKFREMINAE